MMYEAAHANPGPEAVAWHAVPADQVIGRLKTDPAKGLDAGEASRRISQYGPNRLPEGKKRGPLIRFLAQLNNVLVFVLLGAGFVKLMVGLWLDAAVILGVVIINALLGFFQEGKAEKALDSIRNMLSAEARTIRGGETRLIPAEELVPGDVVLLESGDRIPADLRFVDVKNLRTEEAALTGESVPIDKTTDAVAEKATVGDREGMGFSGTLVSSGRGTGVVVATGSETELGRINQLMAGVSALDTPLLRQIKKFGYAISAVIAVVAAIVFAYGRWVQGMDFIAIFQAVVSIAVSVIPEGLPALITVTLAIGVQRMAQRNAIIRRLPAVETLGSVSRICSDKTGTLTLMEMMVVSAVTADAAYKVTGQGYAPEGEVLKEGVPAGEDSVLGLMGRVSMLCNASGAPLNEQKLLAGGIFMQCRHEPVFRLERDRVEPGIGGLLGLTFEPEFSRVAIARSKRGCAPARSPWLRRNPARLLRHIAVMEFSGPSFSEMAKALSKSSRAFAKLPSASEILDKPINPGMRS
jgi:magnesium-transporting ATPase (P-type)